MALRRKGGLRLREGDNEPETISWEGGWAVSTEEYQSKPIGPFPPKHCRQHFCVLNACMMTASQGGWCTEIGITNDRIKIFRARSFIILALLSGSETFVHCTLCKYTIQSEKNRASHSNQGWLYASRSLPKSAGGPQTAAFIILKEKNGLWF